MTDDNLVKRLARELRQGREAEEVLGDIEKHVAGDLVIDLTQFDAKEKPRG